MSYIPQGAEIITTSDGLDVWRNQTNQFVIARVHFRADPLKRSEEWKRVAFAGMSPSKASREYDINYMAVSGSKVFPEFTQNRSKIVVPNFTQSQLASLKCWAGLDYGTRNPSSFHVYTILHDVIYSIWELYEPAPNLLEFIAKLKECPYLPQLRYIAADPNLWVPTQQQTYGPAIGVEALFRQAGIRGLVKGRNDAGAEQAWLAMIHEFWAADEPGFRICQACPRQIQEFETCIYSPQSERQLLNAVYHETIQDKDNHSLDDCKYFMLTQPKATAPSSWTDPGQVYKLLGGKAPKGPSGPRGGPIGYR